jgi:hypothetical protein
MAAAVTAAAVTYAILAAHPWPHSPLSQFLATFSRANAAAWPMQIVWYLAAVAMTGLALWPARRSSQLICTLAATYFAWIGLAYLACSRPACTIPGCGPPSSRSKPSCWWSLLLRLLVTAAR